MTSKLQKALEAIGKGSRNITISDESVGLDGLRELSISSVVRLTLSSCQLGVQETVVLADALKSNTVLTELDVYNNKQIGPNGAQALAEMLRYNTTLKKLWLSGCSIGDEGVHHLAAALRVNGTLENLNVDCNGITHVGAAELAAALVKKTVLKKLWLSGNAFGDAGVEAIANAVPQSCLKSLSLGVSKSQAAMVGEMLKKGARLLDLNINGVTSPELEEGFKCNGWLLSCYHPAAQQYVKRNKAMRKRARKSALMLVLIRKLRRTLLSQIPKELVRELGAWTFSTRREIHVWSKK